MKFLYAALLTTSLSIPAFAIDLLKCNPPMGSGVQEIAISQVGKRIFITELTFHGGRNKPVVISVADYNKKDITYSSQEDGLVHLYQMKINGTMILSYEAEQRGVIGNCN